MGTGRSTDERFALAAPFPIRRLDGLAFYLAAPVSRGARAAQLSARTPCSRRARRRRRSSCSRGALARSAGEGDRATSTATGARRRGSTARARRTAARPLADALARYGAPPRDGVRTISAYTAGSSREAGRRADGRVRRVHGSRAVRSSATPAPLPERPSRSSSACSSATRRSTCSPTPGGSSRPRVPDARLHLVGARLAARDVERARARSARTDELERSRCATPEVARGARRGDACSSFRRARRASAASSSRRSAAAAASSAAASAASPTSSTTASHGPPRRSGGRRRRSPTRSSACSPTARSPSGSDGGARAVPARGSRRPRSSPRGSASSSTTCRLARLHSRDASRPREAAAEERRLPHDRRDGDRAGAAQRRRRRTLRVLMYHKVNDLPAEPDHRADGGLRRADGAARRARLHGRSSLDAVLAHYVDGAPLPPGAVLITFDDGYRDNLENALPDRSQQHGYPAVHLRAARLPRATGGRCRTRSTSSRAAIRNRDARLGRAAELEAGGVRDRVARDRAPAARRARARRGGARDRALEAPARGGARSPGRARSPTSRAREAHYRPVHLSLCGRPATTLGFTSVSGANGPASDRFRLRRYNVEPYPPRTFELVLAGACDLISSRTPSPGRTRGGR